MEKHETFAQRLKRLRKPRGTQAEVASDLGISRTHLTKMETGGDLPGRETLQALATYFAVSVEYLQCGTNPPASDLADDSEDRADKIRIEQILTALAPNERKFILSQLEGLARDRLNKAKTRPVRRRR